MEFLNPIALLGLLALPLLLIPYLLRKKPRRFVFSSLLLFMEGGVQASSRPWGRINLPPIFFLQLLLLALLMLALSEPVFSVRPTNIAVVLDNSASMQTVEEGKTRLTLAKEAANSVIGELSAAGKVDLYLTTPRLARLRAAPLAPLEAKAAVGAINAYATNKAALFEMAEKLPGSKVLEGRWGIERHAIAIPKGREQAMAFIRQFTNEVKSEGVVGAAIARAGLRGAMISAAE